MHSFLDRLREIAGECRQRPKHAASPSDEESAARQVAADAVTGNIESIFPLPVLQQGLVYHTLRADDPGQFILANVFRLRGALDTEALAGAWRHALQRHELLRSAIVGLELETPLQVIVLEVDLPWVEHDLRNLNSSAREQRIADLLDSELRRGFDFHKPPLMRLTLVRTGDQEYRLIWTSYLGLYDGWSRPILLNDVFTAYGYLRDGLEPTLEAPASYAEYIDWISKQDGRPAEDYWRKRLAGVSAPTPLGIARALRSGLSTCASHTEMQRNLTVSAAAVTALSRRLRLTVGTIVQGVWALLLSRYSGREDVVFGVMVSGRPAEVPGIERLVGRLINAIPVRVRIDHGSRVLDLLEELHREHLDSVDYQYTPLLQVQKLCALAPDTPLFESLFVFQNYPSDLNGGPRSLAQQTRIEGVQGIEGGAYPLGLVVGQVASSLEMKVIYDAERFDASTISRLADHFDHVLRQIVERPESKLSEVEVSTADERRHVLVELNETKHPCSGSCIHELIGEQTHRRPEAIALIHADRQLSYGELDERANQLAHHLIAEGVGPDVVVGLCTERSFEMVVGLLGIMKAGGAYLPLDPTYPPERLTLMLRDAGVLMLLTQQGLADQLSGHRVRRLCLDTDWPMIARQSTNPPKNRALPDNLAYVIYTSGSTGTPKGVMVEHRGLVNVIEAEGEKFSVKAGDRIPQLSRITFDASLGEILICLRAGATLRLLGDDMAASVRELSMLLEKDEIDVLMISPSLLSLLPTNAREHLRTIVVGGESCTPLLLNKWVRNGVRLFNAYGPTEATIGSALFEYEGPDDLLPIGRPIWNTELYVLDAYLQPVPMGVLGELYIGGSGVARGYLGRPSLTGTRFIANPFGPPGSRLYRTGDLARYRSDGNLELYGRTDHQIKIRGHRLELGEIEAMLAAHPRVRQAVVTVQDENSEGKRIAAYAVGSTDAAVDVDELRAYARQHLPDYMLPSSITLLDEFPLTPHGKIDRAALPMQEPKTTESHYVAPTTPAEKILCRICADVLKLDRIGVGDNFFEQGGDSLNAIRIAARASREGLKLAVGDFFDHQTIGELAKEARTTSVERVEHNPSAGDAPLTPTQTLFLDLAGREINTNVMTICLRCTQPVSAELVRQALEHVIARHDALRLRISPKNGAWAQVLASSDELRAKPAWELLTCVRVTDEPGSASLRPVLGPLASMEIDEPPLLKAVLIEYPQAAQEFVLITHHLVSDAVSAGILVEDLSEAYRQLAGNNAIRLPRKTTPFTTWATRLAEYGKSPMLKDDLEYWQTLRWSDFRPLPVDGDGPNSLESCRYLKFELDDAETATLARRVPRVLGVREEEFLLAALAATIREWSSHSTVLLQLLHHGRQSFFEEIDVSRTIGLFSTGVPVLVNIGETGSPTEIIATVRRALRSMPLGGLAYWMLRKSQEEDLLPLAPLPQIGLNHQGGRVSRLDDSPFAPSLDEQHGSVLVRPRMERRLHVIDVNSHVFGNRLEVRWEYSENLHSRSTMEDVANRFMGNVRQFLRTAE
jgi:amino acid adenylation domain-containing protein